MITKQIERTPGGGTSNAGEAAPGQPGQGTGDRKTRDTSENYLRAPCWLLVAGVVVVVVVVVLVLALALVLVLALVLQWSW